MQSPSRILQSPPEIPWDQWYAQEQRTFRQGMHVSVSGPTGTGKTVLARYVALIRSYVVVFGTKPHDDQLEAYEHQGYIRIDHWPPTKKELSEFEGTGEARFLLWPKIVHREDLRRYRHIYAKALDDIFAEGHWTVVIDEALWTCGKSGLDLGEHLSDLAFGARSSKVSLIFLGQRPVGQLPPILWTSVSQALIFHLGRTDDVRELASLGSYQPQAAALAVQRLNTDEAGEPIPGSFKFLDLPVRAQARWSITEVPPSWA